MTELNLTHRFATEADLPLLGRLNRQLIEDEGHANPMTAEQLSERMREWLHAHSHTVVLFEEAETVVAYAAYRREEVHVYLRQLFVDRARRGAGIGRRAMEILESELWTGQPKVRLDVLSGNSRAQRFYREMRFEDYCVTMEKPLPSPEAPVEIR